MKVRHVLVVLVAVSALGCGADDPTAPHSFRRSPGFILAATASTPISTTNTENGGALGWYSTGLATTPNKWTRIRIGGNVNISVNPEFLLIQNVDHDALAVHAGKSVDPMGLDGSSELRAGLSLDLGGGIISPLNAVMPQGDTTSLEAWVHLPYSAQVLMSRNGINGNWNCKSGSPPGCGPNGEMEYTVGYYALASGQVVSTEEEEPMDMSSSHRVFESSDTLVFTLIPKASGIQGINWYFSYDSLSPPSGVHSQWRAPCLEGGGQLTCSLTGVAFSGRMYAYATMNGLNVTDQANSEIVSYCINCIDLPESLQLGTIEPDTMIQDSLPDCSKPSPRKTAGERDIERAWCAGLRLTGADSVAAKDQLDLMAQRGSDCAQMAQRGHQLLGNGNLRIFAPTAVSWEGDVQGGGAPRGGSWIALSHGWFSSQQYVAHALAHELDHLVFAADHIQGSKLYTPRTEVCAGGRFFTEGK